MSTPKHPMKPFTGLDGQEYQRRADITMREFRAYQEDKRADVDSERYWIALFMGKIEPSTLSLSEKDKLNLGIEVTDDMSAEVYYAIRGPIITAIISPASSPKEESANP